MLWAATKDGKTSLKLFDTKAFKTIDIPGTSLGDRHADVSSAQQLAAAVADRAACSPWHSPPCSSSPPAASPPGTATACSRPVLSAAWGAGDERRPARAQHRDPDRCNLDQGQGDCPGDEGGDGLRITATYDKYRLVPDAVRTQPSFLTLFGEYNKYLLGRAADLIGI